MSVPVPDHPAWLGSVLDVLPGRPGRADSVEPVEGGITNRNYRVVAGGRTWFVRLAGADTDLLGIVRSEEPASARVAAELGIGPPVLASLDDPPGMVTEFLTDTRTPDTEEVRQPEIIAAVAAHLRALHGAAAARAEFPVFRIIERHAADAAARRVQPPTAYARLRPVLSRIEQAVTGGSGPPVRCHNDLLTGNLLFEPARRSATPDRVWIIDYEYCGMNDRHFDLANLAQHHAYDDEAVELLARGYFGEPDDGRVARIELMRLVSDVREGMWGVVQQAVSDLEFDFVAYAGTHLDRACARAEDPRTGAWLDAARVPS